MYYYVLRMKSEFLAGKSRTIFSKQLKFVQTMVNVTLCIMYVICRPIVYVNV